jgi:putative aminopeptidase FrvX
MEHDDSCHLVTAQDVSELTATNGRGAIEPLGRSATLATGKAAQIKSAGHCGFVPSLPSQTAHLSQHAETETERCHVDVMRIEECLPSAEGARHVCIAVSTTRRCRRA